MKKESIAVIQAENCRTAGIWLKQERVKKYGVRPVDERTDKGLIDIPERLLLYPDIIPLDQMHLFFKDVRI